MKTLEPLFSFLNKLIATRKSARKGAKAQRFRKENPSKFESSMAWSDGDLCAFFPAPLPIMFTDAGRSASLRLCVRPFLFSFLFLPLASHAQTGLAFLKVGVGGRAAGLGEAYVAAVNDPTAVYWNPAGLDRAQGTMAVFSHHSWLQNIRADFLAISFPAFNGSIGLGINMQTIPDIELRTIPSPTPIGTFDARDLSLAIAYSHPLRENVRLGFGVKYLYEKIHVESAAGVAVDAGVLITNLVQGLKIGATLQNLGSVGNLRNDKIELPALARIGVAYTSQQLASGALTLLSDALIVFEGESSATIAGEYLFQKTLALRAGYQLHRENRGIAGGAGLLLGRYQLDYGYMPFASDLGDTHRFSLALRL